jgi:hypothetical protein
MLILRFRKVPRLADLGFGSCLTCSSGLSAPQSAVDNFAPQNLPQRDNASPVAPLFIGATYAVAGKDCPLLHLGNGTDMEVSQPRRQHGAST